MDDNLNFQNRKNIQDLTGDSKHNTRHEDASSHTVLYGCVCPCCGKQIVREDERPCYEKECPNCRTMMVRNWYD